MHSVLPTCIQSSWWLGILSVVLLEVVVFGRPVETKLMASAPWVKLWPPGGVAAAHCGLHVVSLIGIREAFGVAIPRLLFQT